jgi:nicotinate-nucleotide pyrophosphorylase (carboxylating)
MYRDFQQIEWGPEVEDDCRHLVRLAVREDLDRQLDWTTVGLVPERARGAADVVVREDGVVAGIEVVRTVLGEMEADVACIARVEDAAEVTAGTVLIHLAGNGRDLLTAERCLLNFLGRLCGIASLTRDYVRAIEGTAGRIYDTRKTTPGWRRLEKYAVRCGGGHNHRTGLFDAALIKDNHLAISGQMAGGRFSPAQAVQRIREFLAETLRDDTPGEMIVEVEVDTLEQLRAALAAGPDIVLLDNMSPAQLSRAVKIRDAAQPDRRTQLEASGGVNLRTVRAIAETGVERISVGALTHSAVSLDVGLDWQAQS